MTFTDVVSDSRCPVDVTCIQAGEAVVQLTCSYKRESRVIRISSSPRKNQTEVFGSIIQLMSVSPRASQRSRSPVEYSVMLRVTAR